MQCQKLVFDIFEKAIQKGSSDIYFLPKNKIYTVNFSIDGIDVHFDEIDAKVANECINYLKFQANMNINERRRPQMGAWQFDFENQKINCRMSSVGDFLGRESLVIRLIYPIDYLSNQRYFFVKQWQKIKENCQHRGLIIFSGPTGSGKTTSMYKLAQRFADQQILSIEDPVEIFSTEILQLQVNEQAGMAYKELMKVALRHHPQILIIGEIRDQETAKIAIQAALSGHLVLSTVHAANCYGVLARLNNLGISITDLEQTLQMINYQRLIPTINHGVKVLFDQLDLGKRQLGSLIDKKGMTVEWSRNLDSLLQQKEIKNKDYQRYLYG